MKKFILLISLLYISYQSTALNKTISTLSTYLKNAALLDRFSGAVHIQVGDSIYLQQAYGYSDISNKRKNSIMTTFDIGSISKQFTAAAIMKLCDEGHLELNAPINKYLGKYASERWKKVTVHHLLTHQSGIASIMQSGQGLDNYWPHVKPISREEQISYFRDLKLLESPGEEYRYNNTGYVLLGLIIEEISGQSFKEFMDEKIFKSNELLSTTVGPNYETQCAKNHYHYKASNMELAPEYHYSWYQGAGGVYSTVTDLSKWYNTLHKSNFLSNSSKQKVFNSYVKNYGYGWVIEKYKGQNIIHHDGTNFGSTAFYLTVPEKDIIIVIATNQTHQELDRLKHSERWIKKMGYDFLDILNDIEIEAPHETYDSSDVIDEFTGHYEFEDGFRFQLFKGNKSLKIKIDSNQHHILRHYKNVPIQKDSHPFAKFAIEASEAISKRKYWKFAKFCDAEMKFVSYSFIIALGYNSIVEDIGDISKTVVYEIGNNHAKSRFYGEHGQVDFVLVYNSEHKIQGLFDIGYSKSLETRTMTLKPISNQRFLIDGFPFAEVDAILTKSESIKGQLKMIQNGRTFIAKTID